MSQYSPKNTYEFRQIISRQKDFVKALAKKHEVNLKKQAREEKPWNEPKAIETK